MTVDNTHHINKRFVKKASYLSAIKRWSWMLLLACGLFQGLYFEDKFNVEAICCVLAGWWIITRFLLTKPVLVNYPLSAFVILGFAATQLYLPLVFTTMEFKPLVFNLLLPEEVFFHSMASLFVLMFSHVVYRLLTNRFQDRSSSLLKKRGFFKPPSDLHLWLMGFIGLAASIYIYFISSAGKEITGNASEKLIQGFIPFAYAPYFIPLGKLFGKRSGPRKNFYVLLGIFTLLLFIVSMGRNSRAIFIMGFASVGFSYALGLLLGAFKSPKISFKVLLISVLGFWVLTGPFADLGTAMVLVRDKRDDITKAQLIAMTLDAFNDKRAIKLRRLEDKQLETPWDERYLDNVFTARFANIKFNDASLVMASKIGENNPKMLKFSIDYIWGVLPSPILNLIKPGIDKEYLYSMSFGDYIYYLYGADKDILGGYRTGHFAGTGMAAFGLWYLLILGILIIPVYFLFDKFTYIKRSSFPVPGAMITFSMCGLLASTFIFMFMLAESVSTIATFLVRGWIQMTLLYYIIFNVIDFFIALFRRNRVPRKYESRLPAFHPKPVHT